MAFNSIYCFSPLGNYSQRGNMGVYMYIYLSIYFFFCQKEKFGIQTL